MPKVSNIITTPFRFVGKLAKFLLAIFLVAVLALAGINAFVWFTTKDRVVNNTAISASTNAQTNADTIANASATTNPDATATSAQSQTLPTVGAIVVPGASVLADGTPSTVLRDRLDTAVQLYNAGAASTILVSGATTEDGYCEAKYMANYLINCGIPENNIQRDYAGFSTYATMYRAKNTFGCSSVIISTQAYHLPRSIFCAQGVGLKAWGTSADQGHTYNDQMYYSVREMFSNVKNSWEVFTCATATDTAFTQHLANKIDSADAY